MPEDRPTDRRIAALRGSPHLIRWLACVVALVVGAFLAACSQTVNELTYFADPGKYEFYSCEQMLAQRKFWENREQELRLLMDKARQSTGGAAINLIAYQGDYTNAREELKVIDATARIKKCKMPDNPQSN